MKKNKGFDCVQMMREIRDRLSKEFAHMSYEEQKQVLMERVKIRTVRRG
jgi:hypothetical protein